MKNKTALAILLILTIPLSAAAQDQMIEELNQFPYGVTDLSELAGQADAGYDLFAKDSVDIDLSDIASQLQQGGQVYTAGNSAILLSEGTEPVLLIPQPDGGVQAMYICRILPICTENPE